MNIFFVISWVRNDKKKLTLCDMESGNCAVLRNHVQDIYC